MKEDCINFIEFSNPDIWAVFSIRWGHLVYSSCDWVRVVGQIPGSVSVTAFPSAWKRPPSSLQAVLHRGPLFTALALWEPASFVAEK